MSARRISEEERRRVAELKVLRRLAMRQLRRFDRVMERETGRLSAALGERRDT